MTIAEDASAPAVTTGTTNANRVTAAFTPPAATLLVAIVCMGWSAASPSALVTDSGAHAWTVGATAVGTSTNGGLAHISYCYLPVGATGITVTATLTGFGASAAGSSLAVKVLTGAKPSQAGGATASLVRTTSSTVGTVSITTTTTGSWVYGLSDCPPTNTALTLNGATTLINDFADTTNATRQVSWKATAATGTPGATVLGGTWAASTTRANVAAFEVLPFVAPAFIPQRGLIITDRAVQKAIY